MKEYSLIDDKKAKSDLPVKMDTFGKLRKFFSFELSEKQTKIANDVKCFWTAELDFSEFKNFLHNEFKMPSFGFLHGKNEIVPKDDNQL